MKKELNQELEIVKAKAILDKRIEISLSNLHTLRLCYNTGYKKDGSIYNGYGGIMR